jgi:hypothetical protein
VDRRDEEEREAAEGNSGQRQAENAPARRARPEDHEEICERDVRLVQ